MSVFRNGPARLVAYAVLLTSCVAAFLRIDHASHSVSDTLYQVAPLWLVSGIAAWLLSRLGRRQD
ncbi:MAG: hypothetical protein WCP04_15405 [Pseudomonadota bacterium]|jgi:ABC-type nickel/cobalt efflux system permease component RcnA